jgi:hypothetical protein
MILLNKGLANTVVLTLTEKCTLASPKFLFKLTNDFTNSAVYFIAQDTSTNPSRYNQFVITETEDPATIDLLHGVVTLAPSGGWSYKVYEQTSTTNLDPLNATGLVEQGKVKVAGPEETIYAYEITPQGPTVIYDEGLGVAIDPSGGLQIGPNGLKVKPADGTVTVSGAGLHATGTTFTETDPVFGASPAATITSGQITTWQGNASTISSLQSSVATNTTNIATNTASIATNTTNIATNTASIVSNKTLALAYAIAL